MIEFRTFRNTDPPGLVDIWNESFHGRGAYALLGTNQLERWVFAKSYFDPLGLFVATFDGVPVGFAHAGFGPTQDLSALDRTFGVLCAVAVRPAYRRRGIGRELLGRAEQYLYDAGAEVILAGPSRPANPFYFGVYGGSDSPGFLTSDSAAGPFFETHDYEGIATTLVFQRRLDQPIPITDPRFNHLRRRYELNLLPRAPVTTWWNECVLGLLEPIEFRLDDKLTGLPAARAVLWEMEGFSGRWHTPSVGLLDLQVRADLRRQGIARMLMIQILRSLQDQYFGILEVQASERIPAVGGLCRSLGFEQVDVGRVYEQAAPRPDH